MKVLHSMRALGLGLALCLGAAQVVAQEVAPTAANTETSLGLNTESAVRDSVQTERLERIRQRFEAGFEGVDVDEVRATPFAELYEVRIANDVLYVNEEVDYVLQGALVDVASRTDLTAMRLEDLRRVDFSSLPLDQAVSYTKGDGSRQLVVFEDPNCIYCKRLHQSLSEIDDVTVHTLMFPILSPDSRVKAESVWCAEDSAAVWQAWMLEGVEPPAATCDNPIEQTLALGMSLGVRGTPALIFSDGSQVGGWLPTDQLEEKLDRIP